MKDLILLPLLPLSLKIRLRKPVDDEDERLKQEAVGVLWDRERDRNSNTIAVVEETKMAGNVAAEDQL